MEFAWKCHSYHVNMRESSRHVEQVRGRNTDNSARTKVPHVDLELLNSPTMDTAYFCFSYNLKTRIVKCF